MRLASGTAAALVLVLALLAEPASTEGPDPCLEWCAIDRFLFVAFAPFLGWPAVAPDRWLGRGDAPLVSVLLVTVAAWLLATTAHGFALQILPWIAGGTLLAHWLTWRIAVQRLKAAREDA